MKLNLDKVRANAQAATTEDLLDRVTVWREGMEEEAVAIIETELTARGVTRDQIAAHGSRSRAMVEEGMTRKCAYCRRPAVTCRWGWHRLFNLLPIFPRRLPLCAEHAR